MEFRRVWRDRIAGAFYVFSILMGVLAMILISPKMQAPG